MSVVVARPKVVGVWLFFWLLAAIFMALIGALGSGSNWIGWPLAVVMLGFGSTLFCLSTVVIQRGRFRSARPRCRWHSAHDVAEILVDAQHGRLMIGDASASQELLRIPLAFTTVDSRQHLLDKSLQAIVESAASARRSDLSQ